MFVVPPLGGKKVGMRHSRLKAVLRTLILIIIAAGNQYEKPVLFF